MKARRCGNFGHLLFLCALIVISVQAASSLAPAAQAAEYDDSYSWPGSTNGWSTSSIGAPYILTTSYPLPPTNPTLFGPSITPQGGQIYPETSRGIWLYTAPGTTTISDASFYNVWHKNPDVKQCLRIALYAAGQQNWQDGADNCATGEQNDEVLGLDDPSNVAKSAQLWLHTSCGGSCPNIPPWGLLSAYSHTSQVDLGLVDHESPSASLSGYLKDHSGDWLLNQGSHVTTYSGQDPGSGIETLSLYANTEEPIATSNAPCDGSHNTYPAGAICPSSHSSSTPINLASYPEGELLIEGEANDWSGEQGLTNLSVYIDTAPPEIELSNVLPQLKDLWVTSAANHEITVGGYDTGSGIRKIELLTNDPIHGTQLVETHNSTCNFGAPDGAYCPNEDEATWELDLSDYPQGEMSVIARVEDLTGRITEESFNIKLDTQPPPEPEGEEVEGEDGGATITWDPVELEPDDTGSPLKGYVVRYSITNGQSWEPWQETDNTSKHVTGVPVGTEVQFEVESEDEAGWRSDATTASADAYMAKDKKNSKKASPKNPKVKIAKKKTFSGKWPSDFIPWTYETKDDIKPGPACHGTVDGGEEGNIKDPINIVVYNGADWKAARYWSRTEGTAWLADVQGGKQCAYVRAARNPENVDIGTEDCANCPRYHARFFETWNSGKTWTAIAVHHDAVNNGHHVVDNNIRWYHAKDVLLNHFRNNGCKIKEIHSTKSTVPTALTRDGEGSNTQDYFQEVLNDGMIAYVDKQTCSKKLYKKIKNLKKNVTSQFKKLFKKPLKQYAKNLIKELIKPKYQKKVKKEVDRAIDILNRRLSKKYKNASQLRNVSPKQYKSKVSLKAAYAMKKYMPKVKKAIKSIAKLNNPTKAKIRKKLKENGLLPKKKSKSH